MDENIRKEISEYVSSPDYVAQTPKKLAAIAPAPASEHTRRSEVTASSLKNTIQLTHTIIHVSSL